MRRLAKRAVSVLGAILAGVLVGVVAGSLYAWALAYEAVTGTTWEG